MSIEDANSNRTSASAGSCSTAEDVLDEIKSWIQSNDSAKFYSYAVAHIKSKVKRDLFCLEATWVERQYVKTVLEMWLRQSLKRAFEYLEDEATDVSTEMSVILDELNLINCFEDIRSKLNGATSRLKDWCDGGPLHESSHFKCQYLQLILEQRDLFSTMPRFVFLVSSYLKQFKTLCIEKIFARCLNDIAKEETSGEKNLNFIFSLNELFEVADEDIRIQNILEANIPENYVTVGWENEDQTGQDFINKLVEIIAISSNELGKELPQWFALLQSDNQWTPKLQLLTKETFKKFLLPMKTEIYVKDEDGREVIFVYGITVFISKIIQEMLKLKRDNPDVQEIQIVGLKSVHVDCDLESKDWHGINVGVVTHNLYVDRDNVLWDVSGKNGNEMAGELGQPGESGGNVHIICSEMINAEQWTLVCDGGDGSDGLNGGDGQIGPDGKTARKWSEDNFKKSFPSMSTFDTGENTGPYSENAVKTVLTALETILPKKNRTHKSTDIEPEHRGSFFVEGTANDGSRITASYYQSKTKRQTLILCKGSKVGSGGYGGTIIYEFVGAGREPIGVPFVGKEKRKATAVRMDVYETKGSDGTVGEAAGDVGFIHNLDTSLEYAVDNLEGRFIGFRNEVSLEIKYSKTKLIREQCDSENNTFAKLSKKEYASIEPCKPRSFYQIQSLRSTIKAVKKKAIIHQNLAQHLAPINERKQMTQSFQAMFCNPKEHETSSIEQLIKQTEMKEAQLHQLTSQSSQRMEKIGTIRYVKPALKNTHNDLNRATNYLPNRKSIGRRPVDSRSKLPADVRCLDILPTVGGVDSALNSIFGRVNSDGFYLCNNTRTFRLRLAQFVRDLENQTEVLALVGQFVLRMKNVDQLDFPVACGIKPAYIKHQKENGQNNPYNWEEVIKIEELFQEYAKSIELPSSALDSAELKLLARIHEITIDVYEDQLSSFKFKESFNPKKKDKHFVLYEGGGEWRRLEANQKMQYFCELIHQDLFEHKPIQNESYQKLMKWVEKNCTDQQIITSIKKLNPEYGETPDKLFDILIFQNSIPTEQQGCLEQEDKALAEKLAPNLGLLSEWVLEYNRRNISPIFYLQIAKEFVPSEWKYEFVLLELKELLTKFLGDADNYNWEEDMIACLKKFHERMPSLFSLLLKNLASTDCCSKVEPEQLLRLFQMLGEESDGYEAGTISEHQWSELPLNDWFYQLRSNVWQTKINQLSVTEGNTAKDTKRLKKEIVFKLLKLEYKNGEEFCNEFINGITSLETAANKLQNILNPGRRSQTESDQMSVQINVEEIISTMMTNMPQNKNFPKQYPDMLAEIKDKVMESKSEVNSTLDDKSTKKLIQTWMKNGLELTSQVELAQYLSVYDYAVQQTCTKKGDEEKFRLRDTQRVAITAMLTNKYLKTNSFTQVSTGEGKSLIVAGVAIAFALSRTDEYSVENKKVPGNKKIDVVTSNDVLALRDSNLSFADGGLKDLYEYFNITVANNCSPSVDKRTQAYNSTVVYGKLANFQRDYLLDEFYDSNIRNDRTMDLVIVDEVDSMLLDRGNNTLYLSHDIPGMEMLESFYVFVWEKTMRASIAQSDKPTIKKSIKAALLYDLYGTITKDDLDSIDGSLKDQPSEKNALWNYLIDNKVIDSHGRLLIIKNEVDKINYRTDLDPKIAFYFGNVLERKRCIKIPDHLMNFVDRHLDSWLDNALQALELKRDEDYVVDQDRTDTSPDLNPQVIIIDQDTGTDQISSQWDGALHQFIQLKEGCKLSHQSLKAIFISNATYIQKYKKIAGASGTLGSKTERDFMEKKYNCFFFTIPTAFVKNFDMKPAKVFKSKGSWLQAITKEAKKTVLPEEEDKVRSLVIFCQSIKDANTLHHRLKSALASKIGASHIHCYTRDYEKFVFESESLQVGHVIIATNLAGRGTDIKISKQLRDNGGLHICLTFLPKNERIEEQAMGRAGRNGAPGSGIFLLYDETSTADKIVKWGAGKFLSLKEERRHWELQRISRLVDDFKTIEREEVFYEDILQRYSELKIQLTEKKCQNQEIQSICNSVLDRWALWLDETIEYLELSYFYYMKEFKKNLLPRFQLPDNDLTDISWMTPVRSIALGKYFATHKTTKPNLSTAVKIFDRLIESTDSFWYPAAYYYRAFTLLKEDLLENKTKFIQTLRICETNLNEHIDMQLNFYRKVKQSAAISDQNFSFSIVEAYQQQKDNTIKLLEFFIGSSRSLLGSHYCLVTDLEKDASDPPKKPGTINKFLKKVETFLEKKKSSIRPFEKTRKEEAKVHKICPNKVDKLFQSLFDNECLVCKLNDIDTAPKRSADIQRVANDYCISVSLEKKLESIFAMKLNEEEIEKELKTITPDLIPCTRKTFWNKLKKDGALLVLEMGLCPDMKCVIMLESECDLEPKFNREEAIKIDFGSSGYALYNPTYATRNDLLEEKKIMFRKKYIRDLLLGISYQEYRQRKKTFEFNQIARIDFEKLRTVDLTSFGRLGVNDFYRVNIIPAERHGIWTALISQQIIDKHGNLSLEYADQKFNYPSCPAYEEAVMRLLGRTFVAEIVRRHWLKSRDDPRFLKSINLLPLKPYRDMLGDLMSAHVISGARVTEDTTIKLEDEIKKIKGEDEEAYKCIVDFLKKRQAIYAAPRMKKYDVVLNFIERDIRMIADMNNISSELYDFGLVGFDHVINVKDRERSWKMVCVTSLISSLVVAFGGASLGVGAFLVYSKILNFGFCKDLLFMGGLSDILYAVTTILTRSHFTWADFGRQRIRSVMGKAEPIEMIKVIWEVYNSSDKTDVELRNAIRKTAHLVRCRRQGKTELMALNEPLLDNAISQLGVINQKNEFYFHSRLHSQCLLLCDFLIAKINKIIDKNSVKINETLTQLHRCQGKDKAQLLADAKIKAIVTIWFKDGCHWVSEVEATIKSKVVEIGKSRETGSSIFNNEPDSDIQSIEHILEDFSMRMRMVCKTLAHLQTFISDLNNDNHPTSSVANDFDVEENGRFKKGTITDLKSELARKAEKVVEKLTQKVHQITSDHLTQLAKTNPKLYAAFLYYV